MAGKSHALDHEAEASGGLDHQHRERDRNADFALENVVQEAVSRIVVVVGVAAEAALREQIRGDLGDGVLGSPSGLEPRPYCAGERVEVAMITLRDQSREPVTPPAHGVACLLAQRVEPRHPFRM